MNAIAQQLYRSGMISLDVACEIERLAAERQRAERDSMAWEAAVAIRAASLELDGDWTDAYCITAGYQFARAFLAERDKQRGGK